LRCRAGETREIPFLVASGDVWLAVAGIGDEAVAERVRGSRPRLVGQRNRGLVAGCRRRGHGHIRRALIAASWEGARALGRRRRRRGDILRVPFAVKEPG
jgi:hypothetical protein